MAFNLDKKTEWHATFESRQIHQIYAKIIDNPIVFCEVLVVHIDL